MSDGVAAWPLAERDEQLARMAALLAEGRHVVVCGPAGIGKTRLAKAATDDAARGGVVVVPVAASPASAGIPLLAVAHLAGPAAPPSDPVALFAAARDHLESSGRPVVLVDDAHWLDEPSAALLGQLATVGAVVLVATVRDGEPVPEPIERWAHGDAGGRVDLGPLSRDGVESLLSTVLGAPIEPSSATRLHTASAGVPLVLRELVGAAQASGGLSLLGGAWRLHGAPTPSPALIDLVTTRLQNAADEAREVLELIAVAGSLGSASVGKLVSPAALAAAEASGLVEVGVDGRRHPVRAIHPIYGEAVLARMAVTRRADLAFDLAQHVDGHGRRRRRDVVQLAVWKLDAGQPVEADALLLALREVAGLDPAVASRLAEAAILRGAGPAAVAHEAQALVGKGRVTEAIERLRTAFDLALALPDVPDGEQPIEGEVVAASTSKAHEFAGTYLAFLLCIHLGRTHEALGILDRVDPVIATEDRWHSREVRVTVTERTAHVERAIAARAALLAEVPEHRRDRALVTTSNVLAAMVTAGDATTALAASFEAVGALERALKLEPFSPSPHRMYNFTAIAQTELGRLDEAAATSRAALEGCLAAGDEQGALTATLWLGHVTFLAGRVREAHNRLRQAAGLAASLVDEGARAWALGAMAHTLAFAGDPEAADAAIAELDTLGFIEPILDGEFCDRGRGWTLAVAGRRREAVAVFEAGAERCRELGQRTVEAALLHDAARLGRAGVTAERLEVLDAETDSALVSLRLAHARALAGADGDALVRVADDFAAAGCMLLAAEAASVAAVVLGEANRRATAARRHAAELLDRCPGAVLPSFLGGEVRPGPAPLTARELEVANLAASGRPSKEIAAVLSLSVRTVNNLLQRTYTKLGISSRADLEIALRSDAQRHI